ncbi:MAG: malate synthase G [Pseudomonadota bacterium]
MTNRVERSGLQVAQPIAELLEQQIIPGTEVEASEFWSGLADTLTQLMPRNEELLKRRDELQAQLDAWHADHPGKDIDSASYKAFLKEIGYLLPEPADFKITTENVDREVAEIAGPQLVVPVMNARYALNAANARWGSLYDALYGTDAIDEADGAERAGSYNPVRGARVIEWAKRFLDAHFPLRGGGHSQARSYRINAGALEVVLDEATGAVASLAQIEQLAGYRGAPEAPEAILLKKNGLHVEIQIDRASPIGKTDHAGVKDLLLESALTTIQDCEDSVAAVDAEDKAVVYGNWLGLMRGNLSERFSKGGQELTRTLNPDRVYLDSAGKEFSLPGRSLLFVRNVGHLMTNNAILSSTGQEIPEGIMDAFFTALIAKHDLLGNTERRNSRTGSVYIVKPKMHGPDEVDFTVDLFSRVEDVIGVPRNTLKLGIMDEERRTTVNLKECIRRASERVVFINTGFLDRTGDEIHTSMNAAAVTPKGAMKGEIWINAYEDFNVDVGIACGLPGRAQIGKGMWAMPDLMAAMLEAKISHPQAGANTAWVPSPTAATLHVTHYHEVNVAEVQRELASRPSASIHDVLKAPLRGAGELSPEEIQRELDNSAQGILGYVVRWVEHGVGCSKVPDINNVGLMEDRATLRISSQHLANWLKHGVCTEDQVTETLARMAKVVDQQNAGDPQYQPMSSSLEASIAFQAAKDLVFEGTSQPNGYTEPVLHARRLEAKAKARMQS